MISGLFKNHEKLVSYNYLSWKWSYINYLLNGDLGLIGDLGLVKEKRWEKVSHSSNSFQRHANVFVKECKPNNFP